MLKKSSFSELHDVCELLVGVSRKYNCLNLLYLNGQKISHAQAEILLYLSHPNEWGIPVKELAGHLGVTSGAVTQFVDPLVKNGWVTRRECSMDRRVVRMKLTEEAARKLPVLKEEHLKLTGFLLSSLDANEVRLLHQLLEKIILTEKKPAYAKKSFGEAKGGENE